MYNRYIPQPDGTYRRNTVVDSPSCQPEPPKQERPEPICPPPPPPPQPRPPKAEPNCEPTCRQDNSAGDFLRRLLPQNLDTGDLMIILLLLLMAGDCQEDRNTALLTLAIYLFM